MKNYLLCAILSVLAISCSTESDFEPSATSNFNEIALHANSQVPHNKENPFEVRGKQYFDLLTIYLENNTVPNSIIDMTGQIQYIFQNYDTVRSNSKSTVSFSSKKVAMALSEPEKQLIAIFENCSLRKEVKDKLIQFFQALIVQQDRVYIEQYNYIVSYEAKILEDTTMNEYEKETILSVSSISRYALYADSKHRDRDWEISVANRAAQPGFNSYQATIISVIIIAKKFI